MKDVQYMIYTQLRSFRSQSHNSPQFRILPSQQQRCQIPSSKGEVGTPSGWTRSLLQVRFNGVVEKSEEQEPFVICEVIQTYIEAWEVHGFWVAFLCPKIASSRPR